MLNLLAHHALLAALTERQALEVALEALDLTSACCEDYWSRRTGLLRRIRSIDTLFQAQPVLA